MRNTFERGINLGPGYDTQKILEIVVKEIQKQLKANDIHLKSETKLFPLKEIGPALKSDIFPRAWGLRDLVSRAYNQATGELLLNPEMLARSNFYSKEGKNLVTYVVYDRTSIVGGVDDSREGSEFCLSAYANESDWTRVVSNGSSGEVTMKGLWKQMLKTAGPSFKSIPYHPNS